MELYADADGMCLPVPIAPFEVIITPVKANDSSLRKAADELHAQLKELGVDTLYDDRDLSPGVKFKDADLIGVPYRVTVGKKLAEGKVEIVERRTKQMTAVPFAEASALLARQIRDAKAYPEA